MRRIGFILTTVTAVVFGSLFYQYRVQQADVAQLHMYQTVLYDKTEQIYAQAQDWSKPIQIETQDERLKGDYRVMANFVLRYLVDNVEIRNSYLRDLKGIGWDQFLDIQRFAQDKKKAYQQTTEMLQDARGLAVRYQKDHQLRYDEALSSAKHLNIQPRLQQPLFESLKYSQNEEAQVVFGLEQQILSKAEAMFMILKSQRWEAKNGQFFFYDDLPLKEFNILYQDVLNLNKQIQQHQNKTKQEIEANL